VCAEKNVANFTPKLFSADVECSFSPYTRQTANIGWEKAK
jgi:hypothetical protein